LVGGSPNRPLLLDGGVIRLGAEPSLARRLARLQSALTSVIEKVRPTVAAVESPFHGASARSALQLAHARGVILAALAAADVEVVEYAPAQVKKAVTGDGRADKEQVATMVRRTLGAKADNLPHDQSDAIAVALCHLVESRFRAAVRETKESG